MYQTITDCRDVPQEALQAALLLACRRIADLPQGYEEADTAEGWYDKFIERAERTVAVDDVQKETSMSTVPTHV